MGTALVVVVMSGRCCGKVFAAGKRPNGAGAKQREANSDGEKAFHLSCQES